MARLRNGCSEVGVDLACRSRRLFMSELTGRRHTLGVGADGAHEPAQLAMRTASGPQDRGHRFSDPQRRVRYDPRSVPESPTTPTIL